MVPQGKWAQVLQEPTVLGANGCFSSIFCKHFFKFSFNMGFSSMICKPFFNFSFILRNIFLQLFIHITQHFFSTFHCEMLCYIDENYIMDESWRQMMAWYQWKVAQWMKSWKIIASGPTFTHFLLATWLGLSSSHSLNKLQLLIFMDHN